MKKINLLLALAITACLLSCGKGGSKPASTTTSTTYTVSTFAGSGTAGSADGTGTAASFTTGSLTNLYAGFVDLTVDGSGNIYLGDGYKIRKITPGGVVTTIVGTTQGYADGPVATAQFNDIVLMKIDGAGNLYVGDANNATRIRKIAPGGMVSTLAGGGAGDTDGQGAAAGLFALQGLAIDASGNLYVANADAVIRKITSGGLVSTILGTGIPGNTDGTGLNAAISPSGGMAFDNSGNLYFCNQSRIKKMTPAYVVSTFAGSGAQGGADGQGTSATFTSVTGLVSDASGNLFVVDPYNGTIRKITPAGVVTTIAGVSGQFGNVDGAGANVRLRGLSGITIDASGNLYVYDGYDHIIKKLTPGS